MSEKVILTKEQAEAIESWKNGKKEPGVLLQLRADNTLHNSKCLNDLSLDEVARALYIGYEVETEYKVGDWVSFENGIHGLATRRIESFGYSSSWEEKVARWQEGSMPLSNIRHATPTEIAEEKERRFWEKLDRGNNEYRVTDIVQYEGGKGLFEVVDVYDTVRVDLTNDFCDTSFAATVDTLKLACPAENRLDLEGENEY